MNKKQAKEILDKIIKQIFGRDNPFTLEEALSKFAFDISLPQKVYDSETNEVTWAMSTSPTKFMKFSNISKRSLVDNWEMPKKPVKGLQEVLEAWNQINYMATERAMDATGVLECDSVTKIENVFRSQDCGESKNILFCDGIYKSEFVAASQRSITLNFCMRAEDSRNSSNSFGIIWSGKISDSFFIQDCYDMQDCMFCSHMVSKQYCIANMQFEKDEYMKIRKEVIDWILSK
ncbi:hypothetical protein HGB25_01345 [Candidatus Saccharibacteria bacterium]|nr:hypothetical protein [Candidatus Saccharibacteria bacterium]